MSISKTKSSLFVICVLTEFALVSCAHTTSQPTPGQAELLAVAGEISAVMRANHYDPNELSTPAYRLMEKRTKALARTSADKEAFVHGFNDLWRSGPFSHVDLAVAKASAEETARYLDNLRVGKVTDLTWRDDVAVLTVNTMMGTDTIEQIDAAFAEIARKGARSLIIDLRANEGGAFAVRPLVGHLILSPLDAGAFVSQKWAKSRSRAPKESDVAGVAPWRGWSIIRFWADVQSAPITRVQFEPVAPAYDGPVFVLTSARTASAAEMATDAMAASSHAVLVGEKTAGKMLSQKPFDLSAGLQLYLPIADYYSWRSGHIEGHGVAPDVAVEADRAMDEALARSAPASE